MTSTWLIGRGMLGRAVSRNIGNRSLWTSSRVMPWGDAGSVASAFQNDARNFFAQLDPFDSWEVVWCAGAGVVGTSVEHFTLEIEALASLLSALDLLAPCAGRLFLASSVGAVHAGSASAPFTELSACLPLSEYGFARVEQEKLVQAWVRSGHRAVIGRITNLYGPGQKLSKPQGLVSQICKSFLLRQPITLYVSLKRSHSEFWNEHHAGQSFADVLARSAASSSCDHCSIGSVWASAEGFACEADVSDSSVWAHDLIGCWGAAYI